MKDAVLRLFFIALSVLLLSGLVILGLKGLGQSQQFSPLDHPLLNDFSTYYIVSQSERPLLNVEQLATAITYVTLTTKNDNWIVKSEGLKPEYYVKDLLADEKFQQLAIFVDSRINLGALVKLLLDNGLQEQVIVFANEQKISIELKKLAPRWLYVANPSQKMRLKILNSLWLTSLANFDFDFYVIDEDNDLQLSANIARELRKRFKKILVKVHSLNIETPKPSYDGYLIL